MVAAAIKKSRTKDINEAMRGIKTSGIEDCYSVFYCSILHVTMLEASRNILFQYIGNYFSGPLSIKDIRNKGVIAENEHQNCPPPLRR